MAAGECRFAADCPVTAGLAHEIEREREDRKEGESSVRVEVAGLRADFAGAMRSQLSWLKGLVATVAIGLVMFLLQRLVS